MFKSTCLNSVPFLFNRGSQNAFLSLLEEHMLENVGFETKGLV